jgi:hypothetical protein
VAVDTARRQDITALPPARHIALMAVGAVAVGTSGPLIVATAVPALAIAFGATRSAPPWSAGKGLG